MPQGIDQKEAVRLAKEKLGDATAPELAAYIREAFGLTINPPIVTVLLGSFQERSALERSGRAAYEKIDQWKAENPEEAKKMAALVKRRATLKRLKEEAAAKATVDLDPAVHAPLEVESGGADPTVVIVPEEKVPEPG